jgi:hypothetical protein
MRGLTKFFARLYPAAWRDRYARQFAALLEDVKPGWGASFDILKGAIVMQLRTFGSRQIIVFTTAAGLAGLLMCLHSRLCRTFAV